MLTVYGIETSVFSGRLRSDKLQQCLPFTVLKPNNVPNVNRLDLELQQCLPFTVLKLSDVFCCFNLLIVATVLTVYGIETIQTLNIDRFRFALQQCLPFTVLKPKISATFCCNSIMLQQCLPFTVLKH